MNPRLHTFLVVTALLLVAPATLSSSDVLATILTPVDSLEASHVHATEDATAHSSDTVSITTAASGGETERAVLTPAELLDGLHRAFVSHYGIEGELRLNPLRQWRAVSLDSPAWSLEVTEWPSRGLQQRIMVGFRLYVGGDRLADYQLPLEVEIWDDVLVTNRTCERGTLLDEEAFRVERVNTLGLPLEPALADINFRAYEMQTRLPAGRVLSVRHIHQAPEIRSGQVVDVIASEGFLRIEMKGMALQDGAIGDHIRLRNLNSRREFQGEIIDASTVQVHF